MLLSTRGATGLPNRSVLATIVFISTIIEVPHTIKRLSHVYAVIEQTIHTESSWVLYILELM
jgi:hypothetical protein